MNFCRAGLPAFFSLFALATTGCTSEPPIVPSPDAGPIDLCSARYSVGRRQREVVVVLDRSCAMRARFDGAMGTGPDDLESRWGAVRAALAAASGDAQVAGWGLSVFPETATSCEVTAMSVEPSPANASELTAALESADAFTLCPDATSEVPLEAGLTAVLASKQIGSTGEPLVIVIAAGAPTCGATAETLSALGTSFRQVVVLGLAPDVASAPLLESVGELRSITSAAEVAGALDGAIAEHGSSCVLELEGPLATDAEQLRVWVDGELVAADPDEGWSYGTDMTIALNGALCDALNEGAISRVDVALGCDERRCVASDEACDGLDNDCDDTVDEECS